MSGIVRVNPENPGVYRPLLEAGSPQYGGAPLLLGYELGGMAIGLLAADCFEDQAAIRWLCVEKDCQGRGIGARLLQELCERTKEAGMTEITASVGSAMEGEAAMRALLRIQGFEAVEESKRYVFTLASALSGPLKSCLGKEDRHIVRLQNISSRIWRNFCQTMADSDWSELLANTGDLMKESVVYRENEEITGCLLLAPCGDDLEIRWLYGKGQQMIQGMLAAACRNLKAQYPDILLLHAAAIQPGVAGLIKKLTGSQAREEETVISYRLMLQEEIESAQPQLYG